MYKDNMVSFKSEHSHSEFMPRNETNLCLSDDGESLKIEIISYNIGRGGFGDPNFVIITKNEENEMLFKAVAYMIQNAKEKK